VLPKKVKSVQQHYSEEVDFMDTLIRLILWEVCVTLILIILYLLIKLILMLRKHVVTVPSITLAITPVSPPGQYDHGEEVDLTGLVLLDTGVTPPAPGTGETVVLDVTDSAGTDFPAVATATCGSDGSYAAKFNVPAAMAPGQATLKASDTKLGISATATFTLNMRMSKNADLMVYVSQ
jgi:hypothetical protein